MNKIILFCMLSLTAEIWAPPEIDKGIEKLAEKFMAILGKGNMNSFSNLLDDVIAGYPDGYSRKIFRENAETKIVLITRGILFDSELLRSLEKNRSCKSARELIELGVKPDFDAIVTGENMGEVKIIFDAYKDEKNSITIKKTEINLNLLKKRSWRISGWRFIQDISAYDSVYKQVVTSTVNISSEAY